MENSGILPFADCELDAARFELRRGGAAVAVEPQVFELILHLARNAGRLVSKDELIATVWGGRIVSDAALASRIKSARRALGDDGTAQRLIKTVHGRGVRFVGAVEATAAAPVPDATPPRAAGAADAPLPEQTIAHCRSADGARIAWATLGSGRPLMKTANWMTHLEFERGSPIWRHWLAEFARSHRLVRYDQRAMGLSERDVGEVSFDRFCSDLEAVVEAAGLERFPLIGISQGAPLAIAFAARHPERVSRLLIYGGYARGWRRRGRPEEVARREAAMTLFEHGWSADSPAFRNLYVNLMVPGATAEQVEWFDALLRASATPRDVRRLQSAFGDIDVSSLLPAVRAPTLVLHARHDGVVPFDEGRLVASAIPGARFVALDGRNHILLENEPAWLRFRDEFRGFLAAAP